MWLPADVLSKSPMIARCLKLIKSSTTEFPHLLYQVSVLFKQMTRSVVQTRHSVVECPPPRLSTVLLSAVSVTRGQLQSENMKWKMPEINNP